MDYGAGAVAPKAMRPPSRDELSRLHMEVQMWMQQSAHKLELHEQRPVWKMYNSSLTFATGSGWAALMGSTKLFPGKGPMYLIVPASAAFLGVFRLSQWFQLPTLYTHLLASESPLGVNSRNILTALRSGEKATPLPSELWAKARQDRQQQALQQRQQPSQESSAQRSYLPKDTMPPTFDEQKQFQLGHEGGQQSSAWDGAPPSQGAYSVWDQGNTQDQGQAWEDPFATQRPLEPSPGTKGSEPPKPRTTWEEIRAKHR